MVWRGLDGSVWLVPSWHSDLLWTTTTRIVCRMISCFIAPTYVSDTGVSGHDSTYHWSWCYHSGPETPARYHTALSLSSTPPPASSSTSPPSASSTPPLSASLCGSLVPPTTGCWGSVVWKTDWMRKCSPGFPVTRGRSLGRTPMRCEWSD